MSGCNLAVSSIVSEDSVITEGGLSVIHGLVVKEPSYKMLCTGASNEAGNHTHTHAQTHTHTHTHTHMEALSENMLCVAGKSHCVFLWKMLIWHVVFLLKSLAVSLSQERSVW